MKVILTHEQADFDALASLLGASLLHEGAVPVLPRRLNRNVHAFLNLYGAELPFAEYEDLPKEDIDSIVLVDTQSLITLKGMRPAAQVYAIDHHQKRADLPENWIVRTEHVGATTTMLVEELLSRGISPSPVAATLLLLGIYEDTGSFQYPSTTPRDVRSGATLLEQGASLKTAMDFLNPALSPAQRELYDRLLKAAEIMRMQDFNIIIAKATAPEMEEEISTVAHKLYDILDPDALFLIVATREGIRLIARSGSDQVNVAEIMAHFHGGGHERAASALIPAASFSTKHTGDDELNDIGSKLMDVLASGIHPAMTVSQIMSRRPMTLKLSTPVGEAYTLMQRYGYEGFPVVDENRVVGLLNRRTADRAVAHKLQIPVSEIMDMGEVCIQPGDSIATLQKVMAETGWGQIPVFDPQKERIVGIVTRTDLLRLLSGGSKPASGRRNLAKKLESYLSPANLALIKLIAAEATELGYPVYLVGGIVRDLILERPGADLDIVVEGDAIRLAKLLSEKYGGRQVSHGRFGTAKWLLDGDREHLTRLPQFENVGQSDEIPARLDLISSRTEYYEYPSALPTVERGSIKLDLYRRDFTINTLALRMDGSHYGELYDFWGGWNDLHKGLIQVLHSLSFIDDPTRILRAVRFEQRFGFKIESRTLQLMKAALPHLQELSGQRARHELDLFLQEPRFPQMIEQASSLKILEAIHPNLACSSDQLGQIIKVWSSEPASEWGLPTALFSLPRKAALTYLAWLSSLGEQEALAVANRLRFCAAFNDCLRQVFRGRKIIARLCAQKPSQIVNHLEKISIPALYVLNQEKWEGCVHELIETHVFSWRSVKAKTTGETLERMGIPRGPVYKKILNLLRAAWLDGEIHSEAEEAALLERILAKEQASPDENS